MVLNYTRKVTITDTVKKSLIFKATTRKEGDGAIFLLLSNMSVGT